MHVTSCRYLQVFYISAAGILSAALRVGEMERRGTKTMPGHLIQGPGHFWLFVIRSGPERILKLHQIKKCITSILMKAIRTEFTIRTGQYFFGQSVMPRRRPMYWICDAIRMRAGSRIVMS